MAELGAEDWLALRSLPTDTLDSLRSKLVQLVDAVQSFRAQLASTPIHSLTLTYPALLSKLLILLNHTQALHHALATPQLPTSAPDPFEVPSARAAREDEDRWKFAGGAKASRVGNVGVVVRGGEKGRQLGLDGSEAEQNAVQDLFITNQTASLAAYEQRLLSGLPSQGDPTLAGLLAEVRSLIAAHDDRVSLCRSALRRIRSKGEEPDADEGWDWKARIDVDDHLVPDAREPPPPASNAQLKHALAFMRAGP